MKNRYTIYGCLVALMGLVAMFGCTDELDGIKNTNGRPSDVICFTTSLSGSRGASVSRGASGHLAIEQEEWLVATEKEQGASRGAPVTLLNGSAGVIGYVYDAWTDEGEDATKPLFHNKQFNFDGDELTAESNDVRWATLNTSNTPNVRFYAYAPYNLTGETLSDEDQGGSPQLTDTVCATPSEQHDLIVASWEGQTDYKQSIPLTFEHALTAIKFKVGFDCKVTKLEVEGIYNSGTYTFGKGWEVNEELTSDYVFNFGEKIPDTDDDYAGIEFSAGEFLTDGDNTLMMIPQTFLESSAAKVRLTYIEGEETKTIISTLKNKVWQEGKMITYTIHKDEAPTTIYFDLAAGNVNIQSATQKNINTYETYLEDVVNVGDIIYIGSVYVNGNPVRYAGKHNENNRYYVYQSSEADAERNTKKHTGYATKEDFADRETVECRIPSYAPVEYEGQLWSDYITNNTNVEGVIDAWDNAAGAGLATSSSAIANNPNQAGAKGAVRDVGRQATKNRIHIIENVGKVNLTIDNIYSSFQQRGSTPVRTRTQGGISFIPSWTDGNSVLTINIIGDNRLGCVNYQNNNSAINCLVFEGTGSLTVGDVDYYRDSSGLGSNRSCSVIGGKDEEEWEEDVFNITINSGVIYAGGTPSTCTAIGGGGNGDTTITINGGTITAVTNSTGAAIGGGTGQVQPGGIGNVTINGGNVYAYNLRAVNTTVPAAAIGGGGSTEKKGNSGNVTINGGYVYAYSGCGTAIGGGSSRDMQGGSANIEINGGQVIAKSDNGTGIGGGTGSAGKYNANGGNATVTISGNPIIRTGSIGGGGKGLQSTGTIGAASITIEENCEADIQAQFVLAAGIASSAENKFEMKGGTIRNSYADDKDYLHIQKKGGAVYLEDGKFIMSGGIIKNCSAEQGGAVYINSQSGNSTFTMTGGEIHSCFATGTYNNAGTLTAPGHGGAVCLLGGQVNMSGGKIWNNYSENGNGGAVYISNGNFAMTHSSKAIVEGYPTITRNAAQKGNGGGVFVTSQGQEVTVDLRQGVITHNTSNNYGGGVCVDMGTEDYQATVTVGADGQGVTEGDANPKITANMAMLSGGGLYVRGTKANIAIHSGMIDENDVSAYVKNENVANEYGIVQLIDGLVTHVIVTFDGNGGTVGGAADGATTYTQKIVKDTNNKLNPNGFKLGGHDFIGWNTRKDGQGTWYSNNGNTETDDFIIKSENITLYAQWKSQTSN